MKDRIVFLLLIMILAGITLGSLFRLGSKFRYEASPGYIELDLREEYVKLQKVPETNDSRAQKLRILKEYMIRTQLIPWERKRLKLAVRSFDGSTIKPVRFSYALISEDRIYSTPSYKDQISADGFIDLDTSSGRALKYSVSALPYYAWSELEISNYTGQSEDFFFSDDYLMHMEKRLLDGGPVPLKGDPERLVFVVREINDEPERTYATGVPDWLPKDYPIEGFKGEIKLDTKIVDSGEQRFVRAPVDGIYCIRQQGSPYGGSGAKCVKKGAVLGFIPDKKDGFKKDVYGTVSWDTWDVRGKTWEWYLQSIRPQGIPDRSVSGDPNWVDKGFKIQTFEGELKPGEVVVDSTRSQAVRVPVAGVYRLCEKGNPSNVRTLTRAQKGAALGFDLSRKKAVRVVRGEDSWDWWGDDGKVWEWRLESTGLDSKTASDVKK